VAGNAQECKAERGRGGRCAWMSRPVAEGGDDGSVLLWDFKAVSPIALSPAPRSGEDSLSAVAEYPTGIRFSPAIVDRRQRRKKLLRALGTPEVELDHARCRIDLVHHDRRSPAQHHNIILLIQLKGFLVPFA
jgi:hypothetical protein